MSNQIGGFDPRHGSANHLIAPRRSCVRPTIKLPSYQHHLFVHNDNVLSLAHPHIDIDTDTVGAEREPYFMFDGTLSPASRRVAQSRRSGKQPSCCTWLIDAFPPSSMSKAHKLPLLPIIRLHHQMHGPQSQRREDLPAAIGRSVTTCTEKATLSKVPEGGGV